MSDVVLCDRCGAIITDRLDSFKIKDSGLILNGLCCEVVVHLKTLDLCKDCHKALYDFLGMK